MACFKSSHEGWGGQGTPYAFLYYSYLSNVRLSVQINEILSDLSLGMGKLGNTLTISAILLCFPLIFAFLQFPRLLPYLPFIHSSSCLRLNGKGCFLTMLGEIYDLSPLSTVIGTLKFSRL